MEKILSHGKKILPREDKRMVIDPTNLMQTVKIRRENLIWLKVSTIGNFMSGIPKAFIWNAPHSFYTY